MFGLAALVVEVLKQGLRTRGAGRRQRTTVSPRPDSPRNKGREPSGDPSNLAATLDWSGRQDLKM